MTKWKTPLLWLLRLLIRVGVYPPIVKECEDCTQVWFPMKVRFVEDLLIWWYAVYLSRGHKVIPHFDHRMLEIKPLVV